MKRNITLDSVINRFEKNKQDLIETLGTLVRKEGGVIEVKNCVIEISLKIENDILFITHLDNGKEYIFSTDEFTYDDLYDIIVNVCKQLNL